jgi:hypothetical protein
MRNKRLSIQPTIARHSVHQETDAISVKKVTPQAVHCSVLQQREQGHGDEECSIFQEVALSTPVEVHRCFGALSIPCLALTSNLKIEAELST